MNYKENEKMKQIIEKILKKLEHLHIDQDLHEKGLLSSRANPCNDCNEYNKTQ
ncbi:MAG: hypothetical protein WC996_09670 [Peptostreptococcales bacterium]